jgi:Ca2+-transporting ATPase
VKPLTDNEVAEKRKLYGFNELTEKEKNKIVLFFSEIISEPMFILLISCASIYLLIGDKLEGTILLFSVSIIIFITFYQRQKTERAYQ